MKTKQKKISKADVHAILVYALLVISVVSFAKWQNSASAGFFLGASVMFILVLLRLRDGGYDEN